MVGLGWDPKLKDKTGHMAKNMADVASWNSRGDITDMNEFKM